jgi:hypothetical protein
MARCLRKLPFRVTTVHIAKVALPVVGGWGKRPFKVVWVHREQTP